MLVLQAERLTGCTAAQDDWLPVACVREFLDATCGSMVKTLAEVVDPASDAGDALEDA